jgi:hypothetical protein
VVDIRLIPIREARTEMSFVGVKVSTLRYAPSMSVNVAEVLERIVADATDVNFRQKELK